MAEGRNNFHQNYCMKKLYYCTFAGILITGTIISFAGCVKTGSSSDNLVGNWKKTDDFEGLARTEAVSFTIGRKAYVCSGYAGNGRQLQDLWEYDYDGKFWTQKKPLPGPARNFATGFSIGDKGYVGTGTDGFSLFKDLWEYDPSADSWTPKADLPGNGRREAVGFSVNGKGYIACGYDGNYLRDCWEYTPGATAADPGAWAHRASVGGAKRAQATAFVVNNTAYVMGGNNNEDIQQDLWAYNVADNAWVEKAKLYNFLPDSFDDQYQHIARQNGVALVIDSKVYIATGENGSMNTTTWEYTPATDRWKQKTGFEAPARTGACGISIANHGFILTGSSSTLVMDNVYEFQPEVTKISND